MVHQTSLHAQTWSRIQGPYQVRDAKDIVTNTSGTTVYASEKSGLFKSTNSGGNWSFPQYEVTSPLAVVCKPGDANNVVAGVAGTLWYNSQGGNESWQLALSSAGTPLKLAVSYLNNAEMYYGRQASGSSTSIYRSYDGGQSWYIPNTYPSGVDVNDIAPSPTTSNGLTNYVWAASSNGVWRSTNKGIDWEVVGLSGNNMKSIVFKTSSTTLYAAKEGTDEIYYSIDFGTTWSGTPFTMGNSVTSIRSIITPTTHIYAATDVGIFKSTNNGSAWTKVYPTTGTINFRTLKMTNWGSLIMYALTASSVYTTTDGSTWNPVNTELGTMSLSYTVGNGNNVWTSTKLTDSLWNYNGTSWSFTEVSGFYSNHVMRNPGGELFASGVNAQKAGIYKSTTSGQSYSALYQSATQGAGNIFNASIPDPSNTANTFVWGKDGTTNLYRIYSDGSRDPWTVGNSSNSLNDIAFATNSSTGVMFFAKESEGVLKCNSGPCSGTTVLSNVTTRSLAVNPNFPNTLYAATTTGIRKSTNAGSSWTAAYGVDCKRIMMSPGYPNSDQYVIALWNNGTKVYYTTNGGTNWTEVTSGIQTPVYDIRGEAGSPAVIYAATEHGAYKITAPTQAPTLSSPLNGASVGIIPTLTWNAESGITTYHLLIATDANFSNVVVDAKNVTATSYSPYTLSANTYYWKVASTNFVGESGYSTVRSYTSSVEGTITLTASSYLGGDGKSHPRLTWTHTEQGTNPTFYIFRYSCTYGAGDCGSWPYPLIGTTAATTFDDPTVDIATKGQTPTTTYWYEVRSAGISNKVTRHSAIGGGGEAKTSIALDENLPTETKLESNFPNPFNPVTEIKYSLHQDAQVSLIVYDVLGREVQTLVNGFEDVGFKSVQFDASSFPSGVYFYRLSTGYHTDIKRMILMK